MLCKKWHLKFVFLATIFAKISQKFRTNFRKNEHLRETKFHTIFPFLRKLKNEFLVQPYGAAKFLKNVHTFI
jgi:hypothetical protein